MFFANGSTCVLLCDETLLLGLVDLFLLIDGLGLGDQTRRTLRISAVLHNKPIFGIHDRRERG